MPDQTPPDFDTKWGRTRDIIAFVGGLVIMFYETLYEDTDRPWLFVVAVGMMGLPWAFKIDQLVKMPELLPPRRRRPPETKAETEESDP